MSGTGQSRLNAFTVLRGCYAAMFIESRSLVCTLLRPLRLRLSARYPSTLDQSSHPGPFHHWGFPLTFCEAARLFEINIDTLEFLAIGIEQCDRPMMVLTTSVLPKSITSIGFGHVCSGLLEGNRDDVRFCKRPAASALGRVRGSRQNLPAIRQHFGDICLHPLRGEYSLPVIGSVPALFICETFAAFPYSAHQP